MGGVDSKNRHPTEELPSCLHPYYNMSTSFLVRYFSTAYKQPKHLQVFFSNAGDLFI